MSRGVQRRGSSATNYGRIQEFLQESHIWTNPKIKEWNLGDRSGSRLQARTQYTYIEPTPGIFWSSGAELESSRSGNSRECECLEGWKILLSCLGK